MNFLKCFFLLLFIISNFVSASANEDFFDTYGEERSEEEVVDVGEDFFDQNSDNGDTNEESTQVFDSIVRLTEIIEPIFGDDIESKETLSECLNELSDCLDGLNRSTCRANSSFLQFLQNCKELKNAANEGLVEGVTEVLADEIERELPNVIRNTRKRARGYFRWGSSGSF